MIRPSFSKQKAKAIVSDRYGLGTVDSRLPFGGVKQSEFGKDLGLEQLNYILKTKTLWIEAGDTNG